MIGKKGQEDENLLINIQPELFDKDELINKI